MSEKKTSLKVPEKYLGMLEDIRLLKIDEQNPNRMTARQKDEVWRSLTKYGWLVPLITDLNGVFADGEQRYQVLLAHNEFFAPVLRVEMNDVNRRLVRQTLNKLKGKHNKEADEAEFMRIIEQGEKDALKELLGAVGERLPEEIGEFAKKHAIEVPDAWELIIECKDESEQQRLFQRFKGEGLKCRVLTL